MVRYYVFVCSGCVRAYDTHNVTICSTYYNILVFTGRAVSVSFPGSNRALRVLDGIIIIIFIRTGKM